jgi:hypothetical protein
LTEDGSKKKLGGHNDIKAILEEKEFSPGPGDYDPKVEEDLR